MKTKLLVIALLISISLFATANNELPDSVAFSINQLKAILNAEEWESADSLTFQRIVTLIQLAEESSTDSLLDELRKEVADEDAEHLFIRDIDDIEDKENIAEYITEWELEEKLKDQNERILRELPLEAIVVPITEFNMSDVTDSLLSTSMLKEDLLDSTSISFMENDSLFYDIRLMEQDTTVTVNINSILDGVVKDYNQKVIDNYRDSVSLAYQTAFQQNYIDSLQAVLHDSIHNHNIEVLTNFNMVESEWINNELLKSISTLVGYVDGQPYQLSLTNLKEEKVDLYLQNNTEWYRWVWLKNSQNDSIGLRIENLGKHDLRVLVDETVNLSRLTEKRNRNIDYLELSTQVDNNLRKVDVKKPKLSPWKLGGKAYAGFTETFINQFWSKGGKTSASTLATFSYGANYAKGKVKWENGVDAKLGLIAYPLEEDADENAKFFHKNSDNLEINSRFGYSAFKEWYYSAEANFKTQFFDGYTSNTAESPNSSLFSPAYLTFSGGFDFKPNKKFSMFLAPLSLKTTYVTDTRIDETRFGLQEGETRKSRMGLNGTVKYEADITPDISINTKNGIFINYGTDNNGVWQLPKIPDFDSETTLNFKVNQFITTQVNFHFIYDKDVTSKWTDDAGVEQTGTKLQVKQFFTLGFSYRFLDPFS